MLRELIGDVQLRTTISRAEEPMPSPGMLEKHYSPRAALTLYEGAAAMSALHRDAREALDAGRAVGVVIATEDRPLIPMEVRADHRAAGFLHVVELGSSRELDVVAARLYAALRELDAAAVDVILVHAFPSGEGLGLVLQDRLRRAAAGRIVNAP
jgi:L-threonylcarbamoyladenylate synthase